MRHRQIAASLQFRKPRQVKAANPLFTVALGELIALRADLHLKAARDKHRVAFGADARGGIASDTLLRIDILFGGLGIRAQVGDREHCHFLASFLKAGERKAAFLLLVDQVPAIALLWKKAIKFS